MMISQNFTTLVLAQFPHVLCTAVSLPFCIAFGRKDRSGGMCGSPNEVAPSASTLWY